MDHTVYLTMLYIEGMLYRAKSSSKKDMNATQTPSHHHIQNDIVRGDM